MNLLMPCSPPEKTKPLMFSRLDASSFSGSIPFYHGEFEIILSKVTACYHLMLSDGVRVPNNENKIRDVLLIDYLRNDEVRQQLDMRKWMFDRESSEDHSVGRTDIRVISQNTFVQQKAYYILECKLLNNTNASGTTGLNAEYIKNGIVRFTSEYYSSFYGVNGMIGFVVEPMKIHDNTKAINTLLEQTFTEAKTIDVLEKADFIENFDFQYASAHSKNDEKKLILYHLMFDFSGCIENQKDEEE